MMKKRKEKRYLTNTVVHNYGGHDVNGHSDTLRLPKGLLDSPPTAVYVDMSHPPHLQHWGHCVPQGSWLAK